MIANVDIAHEKIQKTMTDRPKDSWTDGKKQELEKALQNLKKPIAEVIQIITDKEPLYKKEYDEELIQLTQLLNARILSLDKTRSNVVTKASTWTLNLLEEMKLNNIPADSPYHENQSRMTQK